MNRIEQARVLVRVARNLLVVETNINNDLDEPDLHRLTTITMALESADGELYPYAPNTGEPLELGGDSVESLWIGG